MTLRAAAAASSLTQWHRTIHDRVAGGDRFAGLYATAVPEGERITALLARTGGIDAVHTILDGDSPDARRRYPALSPTIPGAFWYERALHDLSGVVPLGHPRLDPLLLPAAEGHAAPRPGHVSVPAPISLVEPAAEADVAGQGLFTISFGPVRSGVFESLEYLVETPGEDIPHLNIRPYYKHRGIAKRFEGLAAADGVLVAERVEGIASVAHALAYSHAVESLARVVVPARARLVRVIHAELERIANHLDVLLRLTDGAGLAVATARYGWHKERVMRLTSRLCGNRFGRGVVVPGGVVEREWMHQDATAIAAQVIAMVDEIDSDNGALATTASFLDRVRGAGVLAPGLAVSYGALGPIGRGSGNRDDARWTRPYDGYPDLNADLEPAVEQSADAAARMRVRISEIRTSAALVDAALRRMVVTPGSCTVAVPPVDGFTLGWSEAPQGECLYALDVAAGRIVRGLARSASFHNLLLFHDTFNGDVQTDFAFIEASFGLSAAAVAM